MSSDLTEEPTRTLSIAAIVVTYNRLALLQECVVALRAQARKPDEIIVVNNGSTDGTLSWLKEQPDLTVISQENLGSSGGQYTGIKTAYERGHDWFWCMDDDTIPRKDSLQRLLEARPCREGRASFLASLVLWTDGSVHRMNAVAPSDRYDEWYRTVLIDHAISTNHASFVSLLVRREAVEAVGLPIRDLFIWFDDTEFTDRLSQFASGWLILDSIVVHRTSRNLGPPTRNDVVCRDETLKYCYAQRNQLYIARKHLRTRYQRVRYCLRFSLDCLLHAIKGKAPLRAFWWCVKGMWFSPIVEYPAK